MIKHTTSGIILREYTSLQIGICSSLKLIIIIFTLNVSLLTQRFLKSRLPANGSGHNRKLVLHDTMFCLQQTMECVQANTLGAAAHLLAGASEAAHAP